MFYRSRVIIPLLAVVALLFSLPPAVAQDKPEAPVQATEPQSPWSLPYVLLQKDEPEKAAETIAKLQKTLPDSPLGNLLMALALAADGKQQQAMNRLEASLAAGGADETLFIYERAALLSDLGKDEEAAKLAAVGLSLAPGHPGLLAGRAKALLAGGQDLPEAEKLAAKAVKSNPQSAELWELLGAIQQAEGHHDHAVQSLHKALRLGPPNQERVERMIIVSIGQLSPETVERLVR